MAESFLENLGYIIAAIVILAPRLLRFLLRSGLARKLVRRLINTLLRKAGKEVQQEIERRLREPKKKEEPQPDFSVFEEEETFISTAELKVIVKRAASLLSRTQELHELSQIRTEEAKKLTVEIETVLLGPIGALHKQLRGYVEHGTTPLSTEQERFEATLVRYEKLEDLFSAMVEARIQPTTEEIIGLLDLAAMACISPYLEHTKRMRLSFSTRRVVTILGRTDGSEAMLLQGERVAPVFVDEKAARKPWAWIEMASDVHLDALLSTRGLHRKVVSDLGLMPAPLALNHYGDQRSFAAGLIGGMIPRIFGDTAAATLLGPAFASGLRQQFKFDSQPDRAVYIAIGSANASISPPLHIRMFVALRVLSRLGFPSEAKAHYEDWIRRLNEPTQFIIEDGTGRQAAMAMEPVLADLVRVVDYLLTESISALGNFSLLEIPHLSCDSPRVDRIQDVAKRLVQGESVAELGTIVMAAAALAQEESGTLEHRIVTAALDSLKMGNRRSSRIVTKPAAEEVSLQEGFRQKAHLVNAVAIGAALAPRNARQNIRR